MKVRGRKIRADVTGDAARDTEMRNAACFMLLVFLCVLVALLTATFPNHRRNCELTAKSTLLKSEIASLCENNEARRKEIEALKTDPFYIEAVARQKYKLIKSGEMIIELETETGSQ